MSHKSLWIIDVSAEQVNGSDEIWVWGKTEDGKICILRERNQKQKFYIAFDSHEKVEKAKKYLSTIPGVIKCDIVKRRSFGIEKIAVEVVCLPSKTESIVKAASKLEGEIFEDDIRFSNRFLLENDISPSSWYEASVEESDLKPSDGVDETYILKSLRKLEISTLPSLKIMALDFIYYSEKGTPTPEKNPIIVISIALNDGKRIQLTGDEKEIISSFISLTKEFNPDVIVGYRTNTIHWSYLLKRCEKLGIKLEVGRLNSEPHQSLYGHFSILGRINFDLKDYADDIVAIQRKTLEELAEYFGVSMNVEPVDEFFYSKYWRDPNKRQILLKYSMWRAEACLKIFETISSEVFSLSSITGLPADYVFTASPAFRLENFLMRSAIKTGELIPKSRERLAPSYPGGKVLSPKKGLHKKVAVVDFKAMYPSLMLKYNISPDTVRVLPYEGEENVVVVEEANTCIIQDRKGFFTEVLGKLVEERDRVRKLLKQVSKDSAEYRYLDAVQKTLKVLANAMYGYMGWIGARWYLREGAETVTALGRKVITQTIEKAEKMGLDVIYGDTDSVFIRYDEQKINELLRWINEDLGLEAKIDKIYETVIFTEAKKRYAGITTDGSLDIVGLEAVRGDWCKYAKETQKILLEKLLKGEKKDNLLSFIRERALKLKRRQVNIMDLVIWKQLAKKLEDYEVKAPHVAVALDLLQDGWKVEKGDFVGFVVTTGSGPIHTRAKHYSKASIDEVDVNYYIEKQLVPVCERVLSVIGIGPKEVEYVAKMAGLGMEAFF